MKNKDKIVDIITNIMLILCVIISIHLLITMLNAIDNKGKVTDQIIKEKQKLNY